MLKRFLRAFQYAGSGLRVAWAEELNFRIEVLIAVLVIALGFFLNLSPSELGIIVLVSMVVLAVEVLNTALEDLCDRVNRESDAAIAAIKDLCAAAVLITCIGAAIIGLIIFLSHIILMLNS